MWFLSHQIVSNVASLFGGGGAPAGPAFDHDPVASGDSMVGETLGWSDLGDPTGYDTLEYVWKRDGVAIEGEIASTYTLTGDDLDCVITGEINLTGGAGANFAQEWPYVVAEFNGPAYWFDESVGNDANDGSSLHPWQTMGRFNTELAELGDAAVNLVSITAPSTVSPFAFTNNLRDTTRFIAAVASGSHTWPELTISSSTMGTLVLHNVSISSSLDFAGYQGSLTIHANDFNLQIPSVTFPSATEGSPGDDGSNGTLQTGDVGAAGADGVAENLNGQSGGAGDDIVNTSATGGAWGSDGSAGVMLHLYNVTVGTYSANGGNGGSGGSGGTGGAATGGSGGLGGNGYNNAETPPDVIINLPSLDDAFQIVYSHDVLSTVQLSFAPSDPEDGMTWIDSSGWSSAGNMRSGVAAAFNTAGAVAVVSDSDVILSHYTALATASHSATLYGHDDGSVTQNGGSGVTGSSADGGSGGNGGNAESVGGNGGNGGNGGDGGNVYLYEGAVCTTNASSGGSGGSAGTGGGAGTCTAGAGGDGGSPANGGTTGSAGDAGSTTPTSGSDGSAGNAGNSGSII